jgi:hypothetical protein
MWACQRLRYGDRGLDQRALFLRAGSSLHRASAIEVAQLLLKRPD